MIFKKDNFWLGFILGLFAPLAGFLVYKYQNIGDALTYWESVKYICVEPGHRMLTAALSVSLLANALLFTIYINTNRDNTAKGIFVITLVYGLIVLSVKTFG